MTVSEDMLAEQFRDLHPHLISVAYRLTGTLADAEDAVQDTWLRLAALAPANQAEIRDLRAWCTTVIGRLCLDRLRSATAKRERYLGPWLPEPVVTQFGPASADPLDEVVRDDGVRMAAMVVLDQLPPAQRVAFVLHDAFAVPFDEIADTLGCTAAAARQYASRARKVVADADPPPRAAIHEQQAVLERLLGAISAGDLATVVELLHPDAVLTGDSNGKARTARRQVVGADKLARFFIGLVDMYGREPLKAARMLLVNGEVGLLLPEHPGDGQHRALDRHVQTFALRDGKIAEIYDVVNPDKLTRAPHA
ncbi:sigma-70 family RNA polymerase sigma factor [Tamaricihabitans halophyticus]|nr:sigma-70 family RNA polymerase sigma factor [Tamaricihabitans halophyticus]